MTDNTQPPAETLAPCPFCGSPDASMSYSATMQSPEPANRFVECGDCGSAGPYVKVAGDDAAAQALASTTWNSRTALTRRAGGDAHEWPNPCSVIVPVCPVSKDTARILAMVADGDGSGEIGKAAVLGVDLIWGYADPTIAEQSEQIDRARANIIVAIRAAVAGISLIAGDYSHD